MKKFYTIATALLLVAGTFTSCTKDLDEVGPMSATEAQAAKVKIQAGNNKQTPTITLSFSESPVVVGTPVTITVAVGAPSEGDSAPTKGVMILQRAKFSETGAYTDVATSGYWEDVMTAHIEKTGLSFTHSFIPDALGNFGWRVKYSGGGAEFEGVETFADLMVVEACEGATLNTSLVSATLLANGLTEYKVAFNLTSCTTYSNVKLQGGISATIEGLVNAVDKNGNLGSVSVNNRNVVVNWSNLEISSTYNNTFYVTFHKVAKAGEELTGDWTAKAGEVVIASSPNFSLAD